MKKFKWLHLLLVLIMAFVVVGCDDENPEDITEEEINNVVTYQIACKTIAPNGTIVGENINKYGSITNDSVYGGDIHLENATPTYSITPKYDADNNIMYVVKSVLVDDVNIYEYVNSGIDVSSRFDYKFTELNADHTLTVEYAIGAIPTCKTFLNGVAGATDTEYGSIKLVGNSVYYPTGGSAKIIISEKTHYRLSGISVDNGVTFVKPSEILTKLPNYRFNSSSNELFATTNMCQTIYLNFEHVPVSVSIYSETDGSFSVQNEAIISNLGGAIQTGGKNPNSTPKYYWYFSKTNMNAQNVILQKIDDSLVLDAILLKEEYFYENYKINLIFSTNANLVSGSN